MDSAEITEWQAALGNHRLPDEIQRVADALHAAGLSPSDVANALEDPAPLLHYGQSKTAPMPWMTDPVSVALVCAEIAEMYAVAQRRFSDVRAHATAEAVSNSSVRQVADSLGIRPQMVSRLHTRGASTFDLASQWATRGHRRKAVAPPPPPSTSEKHHEP